jgi:hypothetical protein
MEVDQKADSLVRQFQVGEELRMVDGRKIFDGFDFDNDCVLDQEV